MKAAALALALAASPAQPAPGTGPGRWIVIVRQVLPDGIKLGRLMYERLATGTRWELRCYDTTVSPPEARRFDGMAKLESEWVMGDVAGGGHFTMALRGDPLWAAWIPVCPGMAEPDVVARVPGSRRPR